VAMISTSPDYSQHGAAELAETTNNYTFWLV
jgi:hypothetical protein